MKRAIALVLLMGLPLSHAQQQNDSVVDLTVRDNGMWEINIDDPLAHDLKGLTIIEEVGAQYPSRAVSRGIEGYARVAFTVAEDGSTRDIVIVESNPKGIFDSPAIRAMEKFRFRPPMESYRAVAVPNVEYVFIFEL